jgi:uncharacterized membrane protein YgdD (TMEM256/DUF423 family)
MGFATACIVGGALLMLVGVILGAFGAHGLESRVTPRQLESFRTGVLYQQLHAIGLVLVGLVARVTGASTALRGSAVLMAAGVLLFSGSIYAMTAGAPRGLGIVTPAGGLCFMFAWLSLAWHALNRRD